MKNSKDRRHEITSKVDMNQLRKEVDDPISFMDKKTYQIERRKAIAKGLIALAIGISFLIIFPTLYSRGELPNQGTRFRNNSNSVFITFGLIIYGAYQLLHIKSSIEDRRRSHLIWLYPELNIPQKPKSKIHKSLSFLMNHLTTILVVLMVLSIIYLALSN